MARFKIGQRVVALADNECSDGSFFYKKGDIVTVDGFICCPGCGEPGVFLKGITEVLGNRCNKACGGCGYMNVARACWSEQMFAPLANISDAIEYKMKVSIPELTEIKETQLQ